MIASVLNVKIFVKEHLFMSYVFVHILIRNDKKKKRFFIST